jgi:hypothetical protein
MNDKTIKQVMFGSMYKWWMAKGELMQGKYGQSILYL